MVWTSALAIAAAAGPVGFQDFTLGMTIEEFKSRSYPADQYGPVKPVCTGDPDFPEFGGLRPEMARAGVTKCIKAQRIGGRWHSDSFRLTPEISVGADFYFYEGRLYQIDVSGDELRTDAILAGLIERFGKPSSDATTSAQNAYGASFPVREVRWVVGGSAVELASPFYRRNRMMVLYSDVKTAALVEAKMKADAPKM